MEERWWGLNVLAFSFLLLKKLRLLK